MLQPRIALRRACASCRSAMPSLSRTYAQVMGTIPPLRSTESYAPQRESIPLDQLYPVFGDSAMRKYTPRTPGVRHLIRPINDHLWRGRPVLALTTARKGQGLGGRNHTGRVVMRHRGGGHKRRIRTVDFGRAEPGKHVVERIEHDPGRSAHIALVRSQASKKVSYILAAEGMRAGDVVESFRSGLPAELMEGMGGELDRGLVASKTAYRGNCLKLGMIPIGTPIYNITPDANDIGKICRSAGTHGVIVAKGEDEVQKEMLKFIGDQGEGSGQLSLSSMSQGQLRRYEKAAQFVTVKLASGEVRLIDKEAVATIGVASNANAKYAQLGKAGRKRWLGIRPTVRGVAMNAVDHPHGGGRGKGKGNRDPVSPWGKPVCPADPVGIYFTDTYCRRSQVTRPDPGARSTRWSYRRGHATKVSAGEVNSGISTLARVGRQVAIQTCTTSLQHSPSATQHYWPPDDDRSRRICAVT